MTAINKPKTEVAYFSSSCEMAYRTAELIKKTARDSIDRQGFFTLMLSGGKTPEKLFSLMAEKKFSTDMPWLQTYVFWADERFVSHESNDSNFKTADDLLLSKINIPSGNIYNMIEDIFETPQKNAERYEASIKKYFFERKTEKISFDLVLLGMGNDGHTASLFPNSPVLSETSKLVCAVPAPETAKPAVPRITMTYLAINASAKAVFLISGTEKKLIMEKIMSSSVSIAEIPAAGVAPEGELFWYVAEP